MAMSAATARARRPRPVTDLRGRGHLARIVLDWTAAPWAADVDHYAVYAEPGPGTDAAAFVAKTVYPRFVHRSLGPRAQTWSYRMVTVNAAGARSRLSDRVMATSIESVSVSGVPIGVVGAFDGKGLELALSPDGYARYPTTFPDGVDYRYGTDEPGRDWSYLHPGPADSWAGRRSHTFRLRFDVSELPTRGVDLALWLIDSHASIPGSAVLTLNGTEVDRQAFAPGATRGSLEGDSTRPGSPLKPSYIERAMPAELLRIGENLLGIQKDEGSWIAYDAVGLFARR